MVEFAIIAAFSAAFCCLAVGIFVSRRRNFVRYRGDDEFRSGPSTLEGQRERTDSTRPHSTAVDPSGGLLYPDLPTKLTSHTWLILLYTVACIGLIYALGRTLRVSILFATLQVPTVILSAVVLYPNRRLRWRIPALWVITAIFVWGSYSTETIFEIDSKLIAAAATAVLLVYWMVRAIAGSVVEFQEQTQQRTLKSTEVLADLLSAWGATLQVAFLVSVLLRPLWTPVFINNEGVRQVVETLRAITLTSPLAWLPSGLLLLGLLLYAALRFQDDPYRAPDFKDILSPARLPLLLGVVLFPLRLPTWITVIIAGFVIYFIKHIWHSLHMFIDFWLGRFFLITVGLLFPTLALSAGHLSVFFVSARIRETLLGTPSADLWGYLLVFANIHGIMLLALCLYYSSVAPAALEVAPVPLLAALRGAKQFIENEGVPAANAVGKTFMLYGVVVLAVPVANMLPGGAAMGALSWIYIIMIGAVVLYYMVTSGFVKDTSSDGL